MSTRNRISRASWLAERRGRYAAERRAARAEAEVERWKREPYDVATACITLAVQSAQSPADVARAIAEHWGPLVKARDQLAAARAEIARLTAGGNVVAVGDSVAYVHGQRYEVPGGRFVARPAPADRPSTQDPAARE